MSTRNTRAAGLGSLLAAPAPTADEDPDYAAHQARQGADEEAGPATRLWIATDTRTGKEIARVDAPGEKTAISAVQEQTGRRAGFSVEELDPNALDTGRRLPARTGRTTGALANRGAGAVLPRERTKRIAKEKLTVQIPAALIDALTELVERDDTRRYDEVEEALRAHFAKKGIDLDED